jgi:hypothetical protein
VHPDANLGIESVRHRVPDSNLGIGFGRSPNVPGLNYLAFLAWNKNSVTKNIKNYLTKFLVA